MKATTLTRCERIIATEKWRVFCVRCVLDLGTFTGDGLRDALRYNQNRGGILCVRCRENSCRVCGVELNTKTAQMPQADDRLCWFCEMGVEIDQRLVEVDRELADEVLYLVPHNSKTESLETLNLPSELRLFTLPSKERNGGRDD